jgi:hypothetical protein
VTAAASVNITCVAHDGVHQAIVCYRTSGEAQRRGLQYLSRLLRVCHIIRRPDRNSKLAQVGASDTLWCGRCKLKGSLPYVAFRVRTMHIGSGRACRACRPRVRSIVWHWQVGTPHVVRAPRIVQTRERDRC